jgi:hypothetical protein
LRTSIGLLALGIVGAVAPVGFSGMPFFAPLLVATIAAFFVLLTLGFLISALRQGLEWRLAPTSSRPARRRPVTAVRSTRHSAT